MIIKMKREDQGSEGHYHVVNFEFAGWQQI